MAQLLSGTLPNLKVGISSYSENLTTLSVVGISSLDKISAGGTIGNDGQYLKSTGVGVTWSSLASIRSENNYTATTGQTTFSLSYTVGLIDVYVNGVRLTSDDYTASNGSSIILSEALFGGESIDIISYTSDGSVSSAGISTESDTLDRVLSRGNTSSSSLTVGIVTATNSVYVDTIRRLTDNSTNTKITLGSGNIKLFAGNGVTPKISINGGVGITTDLNITGITTVTGDLTVQGDIKTNSFYYVKRTTDTTISYPGSYGAVTIDYEDAGDDYGSTDAMWNSSTDRFTPTIAGLWYIRVSIDCYSGATQEGGINITKNGSVIGGTSSIGAVKPQVSTHVYMNGSTDYIQFTAFRQSAGSRAQYAPYSWFEALLVKQAE